MEFPHIGQQCAHPTCRQLDFLPFRCTGCGGVHCLAHRKPVDHACANPPRDEMYVPECPRCHQVVPLRRGESADERVEQHIRAGCPREATTVKPSDKHACSRRRCTRLSDASDMYECADCRQRFCRAHRLPYQHKCRTADERAAPAAGAPATAQATTCRAEVGTSAAGGRGQPGGRASASSTANASSSLAGLADSIAARFLRRWPLMPSA